MLLNKTCRELSVMLKEGNVSSVTLTEQVLERIKKSGLNAFITVCEDAAFDAARDADEALASGKDTHPLCGIPIAIKDNMTTKGIETT